MFTGIVTEKGTVVRVTPIDGGVDLTVEAPDAARRLTLGASISINGVCQTAVAVEPPRFRVQAVGVTLVRTTLGALREGSTVNLEPSLRVGDEIGGHLVSGHVDGVAEVVGRARHGDSTMLTLRLPEDLVRFAVARGSIAVDGTSLTVAAVEADRATIMLIPHTLEKTVAGGYALGDRVNIEADLLARYVERLLAAREDRGPAAVTMDMLKEKFS